MRYSIALFFILSFANSWGQDFLFKIYNVKNGLPNEVIKAVAQDSLGYFWIASDDGLIKFDGIGFTSYKKALRSQYVKGFYKTKKGKLLLFGDLDLVGIKNKSDTALFETVLTATRNRSDSNLMYPKSLYEDDKGNLWIAEPQSVVRLSNGQIKRFDFENKDRSVNFFRSFYFFEDEKKRLFTISITGSLFRFNDEKEIFEKVETLLPPQISSVQLVGSNLYIGGWDGIYASVLLPNGGISTPVKKYSIKRVSYILPLNTNLLLATTQSNSHFLVNTLTNEVTKLPYSINNINSAYLSQENDIWLSSNEGLILLQKNIFNKVNSDQTEFVESITEDTNEKKIYYADAFDLFYSKEIQGQLVSKKILTRPNGYFRSIQIAASGLWVANNSEILLLKDDKIFRSWNFSAEGWMIHDIVLDSQGNLYAAQEGNNNVIVISNNFKVTRIPVHESKENVINLIRVGADGLYAGSAGKNSYLFFKGQNDVSFKNISVPPSFEAASDFNVTDISFSENAIWLATSEGLMKYDYKTIIRAELGPVFSKMPVTTVKKYGSTLLFNNPTGLFRYDPVSGQYWIYDEDDGLPSNTISTRGLYVDSNDKIWAGTSRGLARSLTKLGGLKPTAKPLFIKGYVNEKQVNIDKNIIAPYGSYIRILCNSITFPENKLELQYKFKESSTWQPIKQNEISFSNLSPGVYDLEIRSKKFGGFEWSPTNGISLIVQTPFWMKSWFFFLCFATVSCIVLVSIFITSHLNKKRRLALLKLIDERTLELKASNEELFTRNKELDRFVYSASHDMSAPLKSILGLINIAKLEKPIDPLGNYLAMMEKSILKLDTFIKDVVSYSRNTRAEVNSHEINFTAFINSIWEDHQHNPVAKSIELRIENNLLGNIISDEMRLRIIFNNLISNAIKFHRVDNGSTSFILIKASDNKNGYHFSVEDNGVGIAVEHLKKIFDMFFRANDFAPGSGLGLYILKETVLKLKGEIQVVSEIGKGTKFSVDIPQGIRS